MCIMIVLSIQRYYIVDCILHVLIIKVMKLVVELCSDITHPVMTFHNTRIQSGYHVHVVSTLITLLAKIVLNISKHVTTICITFLFC